MKVWARVVNLDKRGPLVTAQGPLVNTQKKTEMMVNPVSSEISDVCEISDLLLFFSYYASQNKEITSGNSFFDVCCVN